MSIVLSVCGRFLIFAWKNRKWIVPVATEGYRILKRLRKINKLKKANLNKEL